MKALFPAAVILLIASGARSAETETSKIKIDSPIVRAMLPGAVVGGGYLQITNTGNTEDTLLGGTSDRAASVEVHRMTMDNGVMVMREMKDGLTLPPGQTVRLTPGNYHLMFMHVDKPFKKGEKIETTLQFKNAGPIKVEFSVGPAGAPINFMSPEKDMPGMSMSGDHSGHQGHTP